MAPRSRLSAASWCSIRILLLLLPLLFVVQAHADGLYVGMTRHQAEQAIGMQGNYLERGGTGYLLYPNEVRLQFREGRLVGAQGVEVFATREAAGSASGVRHIEAAQADDALRTPVLQAAPHQSEPGPAEAYPPLDADPESDGQFIGGVLTGEFGAHAAQYATSGAAPLTEGEDEAGVFDMLESLPWFVVFAVNFIFAAICFRIACRFAGVEVFMLETLIVAAADAVAVIAGMYLAAIPEWGTVLSAAKVPYLLPPVLMALVVPLATSAKSFPTVMSVTLGTQFAKLIATLVLAIILLSFLRAS